MGSNGLEIFIKRKKSSFTPVLNVFFFAIAIIIIVLLYKAAGVVASVPAPFILFVAFLGAKYNSTMSNVEFEFTVSAGILNIDRIYSQKIRKPLLNIKISDITDFGMVKDRDINEKVKSVKKVFYCNSDEDSEDSYYFICDLDHKGNHMFVIENEPSLLKYLSASNPIVYRVTGGRYRM